MPMNPRVLVCLVFGLVQPGVAAAPPAPVLVLEAEAARLDPARTEIVAQESFPSRKGVALTAGTASAVDDPAAGPDLVFTVRPERAGRYSLTTHAATDAVGAEQMRKARSKFESLFLRLQIAGQQPTRRVVFVPWSKPELCTQHTGNFELGAGPQEIRVWLPPGVRLDRFEVRPFKPPAVPPEAAAYRPGIVPPAAHPRLWVDAGSLAQVRAHLTHPENQPHWERVRAAAVKPFVFQPEPGREVAYNPALEQAAIAKAFAHLMQDDARIGREATALMLAYLPRVEYGNILDITREVGAAIYAASCVYDWCHDLLTVAERDTLRRHLMRLADEMECGWPPFRLSIVNGHGNEAVINRDLLALAIAIYNEDPLPYQYCAYAVLEQLVPMRRFEYQSPRHNQGVSYGAYRFGWEMHAAWLFRRMTGRAVFDPNLERVPRYWLYLRLPNGEMLRDGDGVPAGKYWSYAQTALLCYAYNRDPVLKGEFLRQGGLRTNPVLFLLLNDPAIPAEPSLESLPLTLDFGPVLGGLIARTGWNLGPASADVVAEIKGGGHHFGNHQHADAGALQIYYRGLQVAKLAQYAFYGTPYDLNFAKRSVAQSMVLVHDPQEKIYRNLANDGGARFVQTHPRTPRQAMSDPTFNYGRVISGSFGPDAHRPDFSYFAADLRAAYSEKVSAYVRRFVFLNLHRPGQPAAMILLDDLTAAKPGFRKTWQLTTLKPPRLTPEGMQLWNDAGGTTGRLDVRLLHPARADRTVDVLSGADVHRVDGQTFTPPTPAAPEANGHRILVSPTHARSRDRFLSVLQPCDTEPLPVAYAETDDVLIVSIADRVVILGRDPSLLARPFDLTVPAGGPPAQVLLAGLQAGSWRIATPGTPDREATVEVGKNTLHFESRGGHHRVTPRPAR
jgi:heparin/heparan-sulfate lyase